jgi:hypothetical protein
MPGFKQSQHGWQFWDSAKDGQCLWSPIWCVSQSIPVTVVNYKPVPNHSLPSLILLVAKIGLQEKKRKYWFQPIICGSFPWKNPLMSISVLTYPRVGARTSWICGERCAAKPSEERRNFQEQIPAINLLILGLPC